MCKLNCGFCAPNQVHVCRNCNAKDNHRSINCPIMPCTLNCGQCKNGNPHRCNKCGVYNHHRSANCPTNVQRAQPAPVQRAQPAPVQRAQPAPDFRVHGSMRIVGIVVTQGDNILLQGRSRQVKHPNTIGTPGGSVDDGESALTAALRELEEESGLVLNRSNYNVIGSVYKHGGRVECITIVVNYTGPMIWSDGEEAWECEDIADNIVRGVRASHGHKWVTKRDLARVIDARVFLNHARPGLREAMRILG